MIDKENIDNFFDKVKKEDIKCAILVVYDGKNVCGSVCGSRPEIIALLTEAFKHNPDTLFYAAEILKEDLGIED